MTMREGKELIHATRPYAKEYRKLSWRYTISTALLLLVSCVGAIYPFPIILRILSSLVMGLLIVRMFVIYHDFLHYSILKGSKVAQVLFTFFGLYTLNPPSIWKRSHNYHHRHNSKLFTSSIGSFPIITREKYLSLSTSERLGYLFSRHPFTIALGYFFVFTWGMCLVNLLRNPLKHWDAALALIIHYGIGLAIYLFAGTTAFLLGFLLPALFSCAIGSYLFYAQHNFPTAIFFDKDGWTYMGAAMQSSSYMKMHPIMHWFTGNIGYHHIHHTNSHIPFYRLPEVYGKIPEFQAAKTTSLHPQAIYQCLRMKVWDPQQNRMLPLKDI